MRRLLTNIWIWLLIAGLVGLIGFWQLDARARAAAEPEVRTVDLPPSPYLTSARGSVDVEGGLISVSAAATGTFREVLVEAGDSVEAGDVLAVQEDADARIGLQSAEMNLRKQYISKEQRELEIGNLERDLERARVQRAGDAISQQALENIEDNLRSARLGLSSLEIDIEQQRIEVEERRFDLSQRRITAPVAGRIVEANITPGGAASTENVTILFVILPDRDNIVLTQIPVGVADSIAAGDRVEIALATDLSVKHPGTVTHVADVVDPENQRVNVRVNAGRLPFRIGQEVMVQFLRGAADE